MAYVLHTFRPSETIEAVIRLKNRHNLTKAELTPLVKLFNELNGRVVPRPGLIYKIPKLVEATNDSCTAARGAASKFTGERPAEDLD
jgi:hypothetical protein